METLARQTLEAKLRRLYLQDWQGQDQKSEPAVATSNEHAHANGLQRAPPEGVFEGVLELARYQQEVVRSEAEFARAQHAESVERQVHVQLVAADLGVSLEEIAALGGVNNAAGGGSLQDCYAGLLRHRGQPSSSPIHATSHRDTSSLASKSGGIGDLGAAKKQLIHLAQRGRLADRHRVQRRRGGGG